MHFATAARFALTAPVTASTCWQAKQRLGTSVDRGEERASQGLNDGLVGRSYWPFADQANIAGHM
jgi:hypothetical protein